MCSSEWTSLGHFALVRKTHTYTPATFREEAVTLDRHKENLSEGNGVWISSACVFACISIDHKQRKTTAGSKVQPVEAKKTDVLHGPHTNTRYITHQGMNYLESRL